MKMSRRILSLVLAAALLITCGITGLVLPVSAEVGENLMPNGDFEGEATWGTTYIVEGKGKDGGKGLYFETDSPASTTTLVVASPECSYDHKGMLKAHTAYRLSFDYKHEGKGIAQLLFNGHFGTFIDGTSTSSAAKQLVNGTTVDWTRVTYTFVTGAMANSAKLMFRHIHYGGSSYAGVGKTWYDNIELIELPEATSFALDKTTASVGIGNTITLQSVVQPAEAVVLPEWSSSNTDIATVSATGVVTGVNAGEATITASVEGFASVSCTVTVKKESLVPGGDFEGTLNSSDWLTADFTIVNEDPDDETSNKCVKLTTTNTDEKATLSLAKAYTLRNKTENGKVYRLTFDYMHQEKGTMRAYFYAGSGLKIATHYATANGVSATISVNSTYYYYYDWKNVASTNGEWKRAEILLTLVNEGNAGNASGAFRFAIQQTTAAGSTWIDNVSFVEMDASAGVSDTTSNKSVTHNGTIKLSTPTSTTPATAIENVLPGTVVTAQVTPKAGYMMVPGSLKYTTTAGDVKILNKAESGFGDGDGDKFAFEMPADPVHVTAEFVETATVTNGFIMDSIGASVHTNNAGTQDGIRFLTRLALVDGFDSDSFVVNVNGEEHYVVEVGTLLKRTSNEAELTLESYEEHAKDPSATRIWKGVNYNADDDAYKLDDYTGAYLDFATVMMTKNADVSYTAVGYITLMDAESNYSTLYSTNSKAGSITEVNTALNQAGL